MRCLIIRIARAEKTALLARLKFTQILACLLLFAATPTLSQQSDSTGFVNLRDLKTPARTDIVAELYQQECAVCHGETLRGGAQGTPLVGQDLQHGNAIIDIARNSSEGFPDTGMPAWSPVLSEDQIWALALYISEQRQGTNLDDFRYNAPLVVPEGVIKSERHDFTIETVIQDLDPLPFSIEPLPDGRILLSEKRRGISVISQTGIQSDLISGTPAAFADSFDFVGQPMGLGWMMEVALHPEYESNGWIYLHFGDRCSNCNEMSSASGQPVSMNKVVRGQIENDIWVNEETIWESPKETYTLMPEIAVGGRITFDDQGYIYFGVGMKGPLEHIGVQDLKLPYGKIMRLHDDGTIPLDNPFVEVPNAVQAIWSYGHRNPQGLEYSVERRQLWSSEMGPRGGDEINLIWPGLNYGWPLISRGVNYDGTPIRFGEILGIKFDPADMIQPIVDLTPAPAVSSFIFYQGDMFPEWNDSIIVGTLRASDLLRIVVEDGEVIQQEVLLEDIARFRDIEVGPDGAIYILLEHDSGGQIIRLTSVSGRALAN